MATHKSIVELTEKDVREIIARHIQETYDERCKPIELRMMVREGYNGERGGRTTSSECGVIWEK